MPETLPWQDATMAPDDYAALTAGGGATMTPQSYAELTAGTGQPATQMPETLPWQGPATQMPETLPWQGPATQMPETLPWQAAAMAPDDYAALTAGERRSAAAAPRQVGDLEQELQQQAIARLTGTDPAGALLRSQYEEQAADVERQTIEDLQRYGVLRGGGDTAEVLGRLRGELQQGRLGVESELDRRRQAAVQDALRLRQLQAGQEEGAAERALRGEMAVGRVGGADTLAREQLAQQATQFGAGQDLAREQMTGQVSLAGRPGITQSLAAQELAQRGSLAGQELAQRGELARAELGQQARQFGQSQQLAREQATGQIGLQGPSRGPVESLAARQLGLGERGLEADIAARTAQMTGYIPSGGMGAPMTTLARQAQEADITSQQLRDQLAGRQVGLSEAELYGFEAGREGRSTMAQRALAQDIAQSQAAMGSQELRDQLAEAEVFGFEPGREGRTTMAQRALADDIAARQAQQALAREEIYGGVEGGPQTVRQQALAEDIAARTAQQALVREEMYGGAQAVGGQTLRQQALAEDIAARKERAGLTRAEIYGGAEGEDQTLRQQLVESQLEGAPLDRQMMLAAQAIAAEEAGMGSLAEAMTGQVQGIQAAEVRRNVKDAQARFEKLGDDATYDDWFQIAEEYGNIPGLANAIREDQINNRRPTDDDSAVMRRFKEVKSWFGW